jgi:hypothetical protein
MPSLRHASSGGIEIDAQLGLEILGKQLAQPVGLDRGGEREKRVDRLVLAFDFPHFGDDEQWAVLNDAFPRQHAAASVNQFTA